MSATRQKSQWFLAFMADGRGEAPAAVREGTEASAAERAAESPDGTERLLEEVCDRANLWKALKQVQANRGGPGVDGMTVDALPGYLKAHWPALRVQGLAGTYEPHPVRRVEIPKPDGGVRKLGIPTVLDRFVQQAVLQVLQRRGDRTFSEHSYGFRPNRSAHQAVAAAQPYVAEGRRWVVDLDVEKFFDRVNHDHLMTRVSERVKDKRMLRLIRAFLKAGVMAEGLVGPTDEGTPQGGPLSPLLSNLVLDELDRELERRGLRFVRYADDCNVYVRSERAGRRVMASLTAWLSGRLKLRVNEAKSAVARPWDRKFLGFTFTAEEWPRRRIAPNALGRFKERVRELTRRTRGVSVGRVVKDLATYLRGWRGYFGFSQWPHVLKDLDGWVRHRRRCYLWKNWRGGRVRFRELTRLGVARGRAVTVAGSSRGPWRLSATCAMQQATPVAYWDALGLPRLAAPPTA